MLTNENVTSDEGVRPSKFKRPSSSGLRATQGHPGYARRVAVELNNKPKIISPGVSTRKDAASSSKRPSEQQSLSNLNTFPQNPSRQKGRDGSTVKGLAMKKQTTLPKVPKHRTVAKKQTAPAVNNFVENKRASGSGVIPQNKYAGSLRNDRKKPLINVHTRQKKITVSRDAAGNIDFYPRKESSEEGVDAVPPVSPPHDLDVSLGDQRGNRTQKVPSPRIIVPAGSGIGRGSATLKRRDEDADSVKFNQEYATQKQRADEGDFTSEEIESDQFDRDAKQEVDLKSVPANNEESGDSAAVQIDGVEVARNFTDIQARQFMSEEDVQAVKGTALESQELQEFLELEKNAQVVEQVIQERQLDGY